MTNKAVLEELHQILAAERVLAMEEMSRHTTLRVGGKADYFVSPSSEEEIRQVLLLAKKHSLPLHVVGNGSNLLVSDTGVRGIVLHMGEAFGQVRVTGNSLAAQAGALLSVAARTACRNSLAGLEFAGGIPGSMGGAVMMNAGAYGGEMKQVVTEVTCMTPDGEIKRFSGEEMEFGYRTSRLKKEPMVVLEVTLSLIPGKEEDIQAIMEDYAKRRIEKQPLEYPSAGSTFKRPEGYFAGKLIMDAGLSGMRVGDAMVSPKHCGFIVNAGKATAAEIEELIAQVKKTVWERFQVELEPEVMMLGDRDER